MSFHREKTPTARKIHYCDWCKKPIVKGEKYKYICGSVWGEFYAIKMHLNCHAKYEYTFDHEGVDWELTVDELRNIFDDYYAEDFEKTREARR